MNVSESLAPYFMDNGDIQQDVTHIIKCEWKKWKVATGILRDQCVPLKLKDKFYQMMVRPTLLYRLE